MGTPVRSGHHQMLGVDSKTHPGFLPAPFASNAVNRSFRGGLNSTRPPFRSLELSFDTNENEEIFKKGSIKAVHAYQKTSRQSQPHVVVDVHDRILKGRIVNNSIYFSQLYKGTNPDKLGAAFAQGTDRLYWQDGVQRPVGWDGGHPAYVLEGGDDKMPLFVFMTYCGGRLVGVTEDNYIIISDYIYGNGIKDTTGLESWIEYQANNDLGAIAIPGRFGEIAGAIIIPNLPGTNKNTTLLVLAQAGAVTLDLGGQRFYEPGVSDGWLYGDIQKVVMEGSGSTAGDSIIRVHSDIFYNSTAGNVESFKWGVSRTDNQWSELSVSSEVEKYSKFTAPKDRRWTSSMLFDNRLYFSTAITIERGSMGGAHHFGEGMVVLDVSRGSTVNERSGFQWEGLWTGPNVVAFCDILVDDTKRPLMVSHDDDGINRIYEVLDRTGNDELDSRRKKIISYYDTPYLFGPQDPQETFYSQELISARAMPSGVIGEASVSVQFRPNTYEDWTDIMDHPAPVGCDEIPEDLAKTENIANLGEFYGKAAADKPDNDCEQASDRILKKANSFQFRINIEGVASIPKFLVEVSRDPDDFKSSCAVPTNQRACELIKLKDTDPLFQYKIAPKA